MSNYRGGRERGGARWGPYGDRSQSRSHGGGGGGRGGGGAAFGGASGQPVEGDEVSAAFGGASGYQSGRGGGGAAYSGASGNPDGGVAAYGGAPGRGDGRGAAYSGASRYPVEGDGVGAAISGTFELPEVYVKVGHQGGRADGGAAYSGASGRPEVHVTVGFGSVQLAQHETAERPEAYQNGQGQEQGYGGSQGYSQSFGQQPSGPSDDWTVSRSVPSTRVDEVDRMSTSITGGLHADNNSEAGGRQNDVPGQTAHGPTQFPIHFQGSNEQIIALFRSLPEDYMSIVVRREKPDYRPPRRGAKRFHLKRLLGESAASSPAPIERSREDDEGRSRRRAPRHREQSVQRVVTFIDDEEVDEDAEGADADPGVDQ